MQYFKMIYKLKYELTIVRFFVELKFAALSVTNNVVLFWI